MCLVIYGSIRVTERVWPSDEIFASILSPGLTLFLDLGMIVQFEPDLFPRLIGNDIGSIHDIERVTAMAILRHLELTFNLEYLACHNFQRRRFGRRPSFWLRSPNRYEADT